MSGNQCLRRVRTFTPYLIAAISVWLGSVVYASETVNPKPVMAPASVIKALSRLPLSFEANHGQFDPTVDFSARDTIGSRIFLSANQVTFMLPGDTCEQNGVTITKEQGCHSTVHTRFFGANQEPVVVGEERLSGVRNYLIGSDATEHITNVPTYARVRYKELYKGIDLIFYGNQNQLEYDFVVSAGADPNQIRLEMNGARSIHIDNDGNLVIGTEAGEVKQHRPTLYQEIHGEKVPVAGNFALLGNDQVGFQIAAYDKNHSLVIDPILSYSTYLGGDFADHGMSIAIDAAGNTYLTGYTNSSKFPIANSYDRSLGAIDVFVSKLDPSGTALVYSTFIGGRTSNDYAIGMVVDSANNVYVTGLTDGTDYPTTTGAYQSSVTGGGSFVTKLNSTGLALGYSTYIRNATTRGIAVDSTGNVYVTGAATNGFITTSGVYQPNIADTTSTDAFVLKLNAAGSATVYSTFFGGSAEDIAKGIVIDSEGNSYIGGSTLSVNFPVQGGVQMSPKGAADGFVAKLNSMGTASIFSTLLGGTYTDTVNAIAIDAAKNVYVAGETYSSDYPVLNAFQGVKAGYRLLNARTGSAFVTKLNPGGESLAYSTFLGGELCTGNCNAASGDEFYADIAYGIAVDASGNAYVTGLAKSYTFPLVDSLQGQKAADGEQSLFVTKLSVGGYALLYSTILRTSAFNYVSDPYQIRLGSGKDIALGADNNPYVIGDTDASTVAFPTTSSAVRTSPSIWQDVVAFKLTTAPVTVTLSTSANDPVAPRTITLTAALSNTALSGNVVFRNGSNVLASVPVSSGVAILTTDLAVGIHALSAVFTGSGTAGDSPVLYQSINNAAVCN